MSLAFTIAGSAYVNPSYGAFTVNGDPNNPHFEVPNIGFKDPAQAERTNGRIGLKRSLDRLERTVDQSGAMQAMDDFEAQALTLLTSPAARDAFDLSREPDRLRDRYGRNQWGQQCLMARRLVEAGVEIITTTLDGPLCGRVGNWDDHAVNHHVFDALKFRLPYFDQAVSALIEDVYARGLDKRVLVILTGEFGRTPRIERTASSGGGVALSLRVPLLGTLVFLQLFFSPFAPFPPVQNQQPFLGSRNRWRFRSAHRGGRQFLCQARANALGLRRAWARRAPASARQWRSSGEWFIANAALRASRVAGVGAKAPAASNFLYFAFTVPKVSATRGGCDDFTGN